MFFLVFFWCFLWSRKEDGGEDSFVCIGDVWLEFLKRQICFWGDFLMVILFKRAEYIVSPRYTKSRKSKPFKGQVLV